MTKIETIGRNLAIATLTLLASATMLLGAVGPAQGVADKSPAARIVA